MTNSGTVIAEQAHKIASHRSLAKLLEWGKEFMQQELAQGRRVIWAPCHALGRSLSLRSWVIQKASEMWATLRRPMRRRCCQAPRTR